jgi:hypothetical protein
VTPQEIQRSLRTGLGLDRRAGNRPFHSVFQGRHTQLHRAASGSCRRPLASRGGGKTMGPQEIAAIRGPRYSSLLDRQPGRPPGRSLHVVTSGSATSVAVPWPWPGRTPMLPMRSRPCSGLTPRRVGTIIRSSIAPLTTCWQSVTSTQRQSCKSAASPFTTFLSPRDGPKRHAQ